MLCDCFAAYPNQSLQVEIVPVVTIFGCAQDRERFGRLSARIVRMERFRETLVDALWRGCGMRQDFAIKDAVASIEVEAART
jgi:hypothetical protein